MRLSRVPASPGASRFVAAAFAALLAAPLAAPARAAGPITSGQSVSGSVSSPTFAESWTFNGANGDRIVIAATPTGGTLTTRIRLVSPAASEVINTTANAVDYKLTASGTYTLTIQDAGLSQAGTYSLTFLDVTSGPLTSAGDADGGPLASAAVVAGQMNTISDLDAFTFTGTAGNRVVLAALATSGASFNTSLILYPPAGGAAEAVSYSGDRLDVQLAASGTYTLVVYDYSSAHTGAYSLSYMNLTTGPLTGGSDTEGGPIGSSDVKSGHFSTTPDFDAYTFVGTAGNRVVIATAGTGGSSTVVMSLYPPGGGAAVASTAANRMDVQLPASGTYTVLLEDQGLNDTGAYDLSYLNVTAGPFTTGSDADGGVPLIPAQVRTGQMNAGVDLDAFTFIATAGDRVLIGGVATAGTGFNTDLILYPPGGGQAETYTSSGDRLDVKVQQSGTYTLVVEDYSLSHTGSYSLSLVDLTTGVTSNDSDPDGGDVVSAEVRAGQFQTAPDFDVYRFTMAAGNRVVVDAVPTGGNANTVVSIYPPNGAAAVVQSAGHRVEYQAPGSGTYTLVIEDQGLNDTGTYDLTLLNLTAGPLTWGGDADGGPLTPATVVTGQINAEVDMDAFTFTGTAGDRVLLGAIATSGSGFNSTLTLYPPGGGPAETYTSSGDRLDVALQQSGTYTVVVEDYSNAHPGGYSLMLLDLTAGPLTSGGDPDGTTIASAEVKAGQFQTTPDFDVYRFPMAAGNRVVIDAVPTAGAANPIVTVYPPGSGAAVLQSGAHRVEYQAPTGGTYTLVLEDQGLNDPGSYSVTLLNLTAGPLTTGADPDGGPIALGSVVTGQSNPGVDMDAWTFPGTVGDQVVLACVRTAGGTFNTTITLYPPDGGPAETYSSSADRLDAVLQQSGTYTAVIEDYSDANPGSYGLTVVDLTHGALTSGADADGGALNPGDLKIGQFQTAPDFDIYRFAGAFGDTVRIQTGILAGSVVPTIWIYAPSGAPLYATTQSPASYVLPATAVYSLVIQDQTLVTTGSYSVNFQKSGGVVAAPGGSTPTAVALSPAVPNPFRAGTDVAFALPEARAVTLLVFDVHGRLVRRLADGRFDAGRHVIRWDGRDAGGSLAPTGIYWAELRAGAATERRKLVRLP